MISFIKRRKVIEFIIIICLGLIPLLWFHNQVVILGHDSGLTLDPQGHFLDRLSVWTNRFGFGADQTYALPGFFIHGSEALVSYLGLSIQNMQKIIFVFWFVLPGLTMFYFTSRLEKKLNLTFFALPASISYMVNHFLLQGWFVAERTKFSVYAVLPLLLAFVMDWEESIDRKNKSFISTLLIGLIISLLLFFLNGEASMPLFGGIIITFIIYVFFFIFINFTFRRLYFLLGLITVIFVTSIFLQAYWLFAFFDYVKSSYSQTVTFFGGQAGIFDWLKYVSQNSSIINLFRLQGIPEWYQNPQHPYASFFLKNPIMISVGYILPILAFVSLYFYERDKKVLRYILFFTILALFSMIFIAGSHEPFGYIYVLLFKYVPGFIAFRTPFYKFSPALWLSYSILISFTVNFIVCKYIKSKRIVSLGFYIFILAGIVLYSYPFLNGSFFDYIVGSRTNRVTVPQYIYDFGKWSQTKDRIEKRTLVLPPPNIDSKAEVYTWGYWSLAPLTSLLTNASVINQSLYMTSTEDSMVHTLYVLMKKNDPTWMKLARFLNINSILLRRDFKWDLTDSPTDSPQDYDNVVKNNNVSLVRKFGKWEVYDIKNDNSSKIEQKNSISYLQGNGTDIGTLITVPGFNEKQALYVSSMILGSSTNILDLSDSVYVKANCVMCDLQWQYINVDLYRPILTRGSLFYPLISMEEERKLKFFSSTLSTKLSYLVDHSLEQLNSIQKVMDEFKPLDIVLSSIEDYKRTLNDLDRSIDIYISNPKDIDNNLLFTVSSRIHFENNTLIDRIRSIQPDYKGNDAETILKMLNIQYLQINDINKKLNQKLWRTQNENQKRFTLSIPKNGTYQIFYKPNINLPQDKIQFSLNGVEESHNAIRDESGWYDLGEQTLTKGNYNFEVIQPTINLYNKNSQIDLITAATGSCFQTNPILAKKDDIFRINFLHRRISGNESFYTGITTDNEKIYPLSLTNDLNTSLFTSEFQQDYAVSKDQIFRFNICSYPQKNEEKIQSSIEVQDMKIQKLNIPDLIFSFQNRSDGAVISMSKPQYSKESLTQYYIESIKNTNSGKPSVITLNDSYNSDWVMGTGNYKNIIENGYANSWIVDNVSKVKIVYERQKIAILGFVCTTIAFIISIILVIFLKLKKNKK